VEELRLAEEAQRSCEAGRHRAETELREMVVRVEQVEHTALRDGKRIIAKLQGRVRSTCVYAPQILVYRSHTHIHPFNGPFSGTGTRKVEPIWILLKQETVSGSGISWAICKSAPRSEQITTPASHHSVFLQAGCPSCRPTQCQSTEGTHTHSPKITGRKRKYL